MTSLDRCRLRLGGRRRLHLFDRRGLWLGDRRGELELAGASFSIVSTTGSSTTCGWPRLPPAGEQAGLFARELSCGRGPAQTGERRAVRVSSTMGRSAVTSSRLLARIGWGCSAAGPRAAPHRCRACDASNGWVRSDSPRRDQAASTRLRGQRRASRRGSSPAGLPRPASRPAAYGVPLGREKRLGGGPLGLALLGSGMARGARGGPASAGVVVTVIGRPVVGARRGLGPGVGCGARSGVVLARAGVAASPRERCRFIAREHVCRDLQRVGAPTLDRLIGL